MLTNFVEVPRVLATGEAPLPSRGELTVGFLKGSQALSPMAHLRSTVEPFRGEYNGFNLIVGDVNTGEFAYVGNRGDAAAQPPFSFSAACAPHGFPPKVQQPASSATPPCVANGVDDDKESRGIQGLSLGSDRRLSASQLISDEGGVSDRGNRDLSLDSDHQLSTSQPISNEGGESDRGKVEMGSGQAIGKPYTLYPTIHSPPESHIANP